MGLVDLWHVRPSQTGDGPLAHQGGPRLLLNRQQCDLYVLHPVSLPLGHICDKGVSGEAGGPCASSPACLGPPWIKCFRRPSPFQLESLLSVDFLCFLWRPEKIAVSAVLLLAAWLTAKITSQWIVSARGELRTWAKPWRWAYWQQWLSKLFKFFEGARRSSYSYGVVTGDASSCGARGSRPGQGSHADLMWSHFLALEAWETKQENPCAIRIVAWTTSRGKGNTAAALLTGFPILYSESKYAWLVLCLWTLSWVWEAAYPGRFCRSTLQPLAEVLCLSGNC